MSAEKEDPLAFYVPRLLDAPPKFLFWDWDVAMIFIFFLMFGVITEYLFTSIGVGTGMAWWLGKAKGGRRSAFSAHIAYWFLGVGGFKRTPPSHLRDFIGG